MQPLDLLTLVQDLSVLHFAKPFNGQVRWNARLRTSAGRCVHPAGSIELNPRYMDYYGEQALIDTLKHELIHYHYPKAGHGPVFQREAQRIGCQRHCLPLPGQVTFYVYKCQDCGQGYRRRKRVNLRKYRCGKCRGRLKLISREQMQVKVPLPTTPPTER